MSTNIVILAKPALAKLAAEIRHHVKLGDQCAAQSRMRASEAEEHYKAAGMRLIRLKKDKPKNVTWPVLVRRECDLSRERADELIRIAKGDTTLERQRERTKLRMRKSRSLSRDTGNTPIKSMPPVQENPEEQTRRFLARAQWIIEWAGYSGPIDRRVIDAAHAIVQAWQQFVRNLPKEAVNEN